MANPYFSFKQFTVYHDRCAMKVGIDGVLLGVWANVENTGRILDIGTGSGLIALMLAQRSTSDIDAIDIDANAVLQASVNITSSPWGHRVNVQEISLQDFAKTTTRKYDLIVSNPPYFINSFKSPTDNRTFARHTVSLSHEELILNAQNMLHPTGRICIILPVIEAEQCEVFATSHGLYCNREVRVIPKPNGEVKRLMMEFGSQPCLKEITELIIESDERHCYSEEFTALAKDFYLKL